MLAGDKGSATAHRQKSDHPFCEMNKKRYQGKGLFIYYYVIIAVPGEGVWFSHPPAANFKMTRFFTVVRVQARRGIIVRLWIFWIFAFTTFDESSSFYLRGDLPHSHLLSFSHFLLASIYPWP